MPYVIDAVLFRSLGDAALKYLSLTLSSISHSISHLSLERVLLGHGIGGYLQLKN